MKTINAVTEITNDALLLGNEANLSRAFPYIKDGLKPSQRATLFTAFEHGYSSNKPHIKSLKLDGQIVGEYWPHGSEYSTIVRLTQPFIMNIPLLDMHGANGSQLGTPDAAASRYTEVRLSKATEEGLLATLDKNTCDMIPNYSEDKEWPKLFPALLPNLFVNGSEGMGYCYAQTWLPGNLNEFYEKVLQYLNLGYITYDNIYPDFPTKGVIINKKDIAEAYKTGQGTITLRGKAEIEGNLIKITELPYQVYVSDYIEELKALITPNAKGIIKITGISDIFNMSGETGMLIEIECEEDPNYILQKLYQYSKLQINLTINQFGLLDSIPQLFSLQDYIKYYVEHNITCVKREYTYLLTKAQQRLEIVEGLLQAISKLDSIITLIKASKSAEEAKLKLISTYYFTENQAKAIIEMKLGKLANLETTELTKEQTSLSKTIDNCTKLLSSEKRQQKEFLTRLDSFVKNYGYSRRTEVVDIDFEVEKLKIKPAKASTSFSEDYMLVFSRVDNCIKRVTLKEFISKQEKSKSKFDIAIRVNEKSRFILISDTGYMYKLNANKIDICTLNSKGTPINKFIKDTIISIFAGTEFEKYLFFITKNGLAKKIDASVVFEVSKLVGTPVMKLNASDKIIDCRLVNPGAEISVTAGKKDKIISTDKFISKGRLAGGVCAIKLKPTETFLIK